MPRRVPGPKPPKARTRSASTPCIHGLYTSCLVLDCENKNLYNDLYLGFHARFRPVDVVELELVDRLVATVWRLRRLTGIETGLLNVAQLYAQSELTRANPKFSAKEDLGYAFHEKGGNRKHDLAELSLQRGRIERAYYRAMAELRCLQEERLAGSPTEPLPVTLPYPPPPPDDDLDDDPLRPPEPPDGPTPPPSQPPSEPLASPAASPAQPPVGFVSPTSATPTIQTPNGASAAPQTAPAAEVCPPVRPPAPSSALGQPHADKRRRSRRPRSARRRR